jgi:hypothetical protein
VSVELLLEIGLGVLDSRECAQRSRELLATSGAGGDARHRAKVFNVPDSALCHELHVRAYKMPVNAFRVVYGERKRATPPFSLVLGMMAGWASGSAVLRDEPALATG